ncbi:MAG: hypothetical protein HOP11_14695 [Saprospiraceae bacterium]|nr:hypothetical protein [Saprospiraceae bacterium]
MNLNKPLKKIAFSLLLTACLHTILYSQDVRQNIGIIGFARIEFGLPKRNYVTNISAGINLGFHREIPVTKNFYVDIAFQPGITLYQNGIGTSILEFNKKDETNNIEDKILRQSSNSQIDIVNGFSITLGGAKKPLQIQHENKNFHFFYRSSLVQDYNSSITLGTNFISNFNGRHQQVGFARATIWKAVIAYYNDGTPYQYILTGDGKDRWWTGGGYFQYGNDRLVDSSDSKRFSFALGFDRFTGYSHGMFELSNILKQAIVLHKDERQYFLNSGKVYLVANDLRRDYSVNFSLNNMPWLDIQNLIHNKGTMAKHYSVLKESYSLGATGFYPIIK